MIRWLHNWLRTWLGIGALETDVIVLKSYRPDDGRLLNTHEHRLANLELTLNPIVLCEGQTQLPKRTAQEAPVFVDYSWAFRFDAMRPGSTCEVGNAPSQAKKIKRIELLAGPYTIRSIRIGHFCIMEGDCWPPGKPFEIPEHMQLCDVGCTVSVMIARDVSSS